MTVIVVLSASPRKKKPAFEEILNKVETIPKVSAYQSNRRDFVSASRFLWHFFSIAIVRPL